MRSGAEQVVGSRLVAAVSEAERRLRARFADAIHDGPLQLAAAARQELAEAARSGDGEALATLDTLLAELTESLRGLTAAMNEPSLERAGLAAAVTRLAAAASRRESLSVEASVEEDAAGIHDGVVRDVVRELLSNVIKHAQATSAVVSVAHDRDADDVVVRVRDDGRGLEPGALERAAERGSVGFERLRQTAADFGGAVAVSGPPGEGVTVTVRLPCRALEDQRTLEDQLRDEQRWSSALLAAIDDGLLVLRDGRVAHVNEALAHMTGLSSDKLLAGDLPLDILPTQEGAYELSLRRADGTMMRVACSVRRMPDGRGESAGLLVTFKDLTERLLGAELESSIRSVRSLTRLTDATAAQQLWDELGALLADPLGWLGVVVNERLADGSHRVVWTSDAEMEDALGGVVYAPGSLEHYLEPRFERSGAYFVPSGHGIIDETPFHVTVGPRLEHPDAWDLEDQLFVPLEDAWGVPLGIVSVDAPASGLRPSDVELELLVAVVRHAARCLARLREQ